MACVLDATTDPYISRINSLLHDADHGDAEVGHWPRQKIDMYNTQVSDPAAQEPNGEVVKKRGQKRGNLTTFHDGQPVASHGSGSLDSPVGEGMEQETLRYLTFMRRSWPRNAPVSPGVLAKAGFIYTGPNDTVQCFSCGGRVNNWAPGDTAMGEHKRLYPNCEFVRGVDDRNVPAWGLLDEGSIGTAGEKGSKSGASASPAHEAGCAENSLEYMVGSLKIKETRDPEPLIPSTSPDFRNESTRLLTFNHWPVSCPVDRFDLAAAGFRCIGESSGVVQCFACLGKLSQWKLGDRPEVEHKRKFPSCPFVSGHDTGNKPLTKSQKEYAVRFFSENSSQRQPQQIAANLPETRGSRTAGEHSIGRRIHPLTVATSPAPEPLTVRNAKYPQQAYQQARLETYRNWPRNHSQIPTDLARAGFFARGTEDEVRCFYCGGGLKDWAGEDDPWEEHARWFPGCEWLWQQRGPGFVEAIRRRYGASETYYESNLGIPGDLTPTSRPLPPTEEIRFPPHRYTAPPMAAEPRQTPTPQRAPDARQSEAKRQEPRKKPAKKEQPGKKKRGNKKTTSLDERVEAQLQTDMVRTMLDMGHDEAVVRSTLRRRFQSGRNAFGSFQELLTAIFEEEELQERGASNAEPEESLINQLGGRDQSEHGPLREALESMGSPEDTSPPHSRGESPQRHGSDLQSEEVEKLREKNLCKICLDQNVEMLFLPCQHLVTCADCATKVEICPICRGPIDDRIFVYMP